MGSSNNATWVQHEFKEQLWDDGEGWRAERERLERKTRMVTKSIMWPTLGRKKKQQITNSSKQKRTWGQQSTQHFTIYYIMRSVVSVRAFGCLTFMAATSRAAFEKLCTQAKLNVQPEERHNTKRDTF